MAYCIGCGVEIPARRLAALPNTKVCVRCSTVRPVVGMRVFSGKQDADLIVVNPDDKEALHYMRQEMNRGFQHHAHPASTGDLAIGMPHRFRTLAAIRFHGVLLPEVGHALARRHGLTASPPVEDEESETEGFATGSLEGWVQG